jgi:hypothetical protein
VAHGTTSMIGALAVGVGPRTIQGGGPGRCRYLTYMFSIYFPSHLDSSISSFSLIIRLCWWNIVQVSLYSSFGFYGALDFASRVASFVPSLISCRVFCTFVVCISPGSATNIYLDGKWSFLLLICILRFVERGTGKKPWHSRAYRAMFAR